MKKIMLALSLLLCANPVLAQYDNQVIDLFSSDVHREHLLIAVQNYYKHPNPQQALDLSQQLIQQPTFEQHPNLQLNTWLWGAQILQQQPKLTRKWCKSLKKSQNHAQIAPLFQFANTKAAKRCLKSLKLNPNEQENLAQLPDLSAPLERELKVPLDLDMLWTTFFATGNPRVVHKIVDVLVSDDATQHNPIYLAALWSLYANIHQDGDIKKIIDEYVHSLSPQKQKIFKDALQLIS